MTDDAKEKPEVAENVVDMFAFKKKPQQKEDLKTEEARLSLEEVAERNKKVKERVEKERNQANKSVLRSYRIKN